MNSQEYALHCTLDHLTRCEPGRKFFHCKGLAIPVSVSKLILLLFIFGKGERDTIFELLLGVNARHHFFNEIALRNALTSTGTSHASIDPSLDVGQANFVERSHAKHQSARASPPDGGLVETKHDSANSSDDATIERLPAYNVCVRVFTLACADQVFFALELLLVYLQQTLRLVNVSLGGVGNLDWSCADEVVGLRIIQFRRSVVLPSQSRPVQGPETHLAGHLIERAGLRHRSVTANPIGLTRLVLTGPSPPI